MSNNLCRFGSLAAGLLLVMNVSAHEISAPSMAAGMRQAVEAFFEALSSDQREAAMFPFEDSERFNWHYVPRSRAGLALKDMTAEQRSLALALMQSGLSTDGFRKAAEIMALEAVLREIETFNWMGRDPEKYFFSFFGQPSASGTWGWRVEGHHLSLNITVVKGHLFAAAPRFLGANPATVRSGALAGRRALAGEEDLARMLVRSLDRNQRQKAVFREQAYRDIVTGSDAEVAPPTLVGIPASDLDAAQTTLLIKLLGEYIKAMPDEFARPRLAAILRSGWEAVYFGWAGGLAPGQPHYYRIQGPSFLVEYDNVQNDANHIHTVWRDFTGDFGRDLLREHYRTAHH